LQLLTPPKGFVWALCGSPYHLICPQHDRFRNLNAESLCRLAIYRQHECRGLLNGHFPRSGACQYLIQDHQWAGRVGQIANYFGPWCDGKKKLQHPDKTHVGDCRVQGQGFEFLGYRFEGGKRQVRKKSLMALRDKIRAHTKRCGGHSVQIAIASLNPILRGWYGYFQHAHRFTFSAIDGFVRRRLRALMRRQHHRRGQRPQLARSYTLAECLLRWSWAVHDVCSSFIGAPIPMR